MRLPISDITQLLLSFRNRSSEPYPERSHEPDFDVLVPEDKSKKPLFDYLSLRKTMRSMPDSPSLLLETVSQHIKVLNRYRTACSVRLRHLDLACRYSFSAIRDVYNYFNEQEEFPETQQRRQALVSAISAVRQLSAGYKLVMLEYCSLPDRLFYPLNDRIQTIGFRIMELVYLEQHLGALRYQKLPEHSWRDCNQLFFFLHGIGFDTESKPFSASVHDQLFPGKAHEMTGTDESSVRQLYVLIQLMGLMDVINWPRESVKIVESYVFRAAARVDIIMDDGRELQQGNMVIYRQQICPPFFNRLETGGDATLILDVSAFEKQLRNTYDKVVAENAKNMKTNAMSLSLDEFDEQGLLDKMLGKLFYFRRSEPRNYVNQFVDLQLFFGFRECFKFIRDMANSGHELLNSGFSLRETLAGQTSLIVPGDNADLENRWFVINESQGGMHLRMQETQYSPGMFIGQMVVVNMQQQNDSNLHIGYISRINRGRGNDVEITIIKIGHNAECVGVQDEELKNQGDLVPSILLSSYSGAKLLLMYSKQQIRLGSDLYIIWKNDNQVLELGQKNIKMPEFVGFEVNYYAEDVS